MFQLKCSSTGRQHTVNRIEFLLYLYVLALAVSCIWWLLLLPTDIYLKPNSYIFHLFPCDTCQPGSSCLVLTKALGHCGMHIPQRHASRMRLPSEPQNTDQDCHPRTMRHQAALEAGGSRHRSMNWRWDVWCVRSWCPGSQIGWVQAAVLRASTGLMELTTW